MRLTSAGRPHLTYCTNIHPGESWAEVRRNLETHVLAVRTRAAPEGRFGVGLRLSARAAEELSAPGELESLKAFLAEHGLYVFTINGFPHGTFHRAPVKEGVYQPDWLDPARLAYSDRLAVLLAQLLPDEGDVEGTVSTVPGAFKPRVRSEADAGAMAELMIRHAATLHALRERTGRTIALALEPEPCCFLETTAETVAFFERCLFASRAVERFASLTGLDRATSEVALRHHLGVCLDACHAAVEFEDVAESLSAFSRAGIRIGKIQVSAGLAAVFDSEARATLAALRPYAEGVYLHQVVERRDGVLERFLDLPDALAAADGRSMEGAEWRIHFHVPLFQEELGPFRSTQRWLRELLEIVRRTEVSSHLEIETYTWDVLPEEHRRQDVDAAIAHEIAWVRARLDGLPPQGC